MGRFENGCTVHGPACAARERALAQAANLLRRSTLRGSSLLAGSVVVDRLSALTCFVDEHDSCAVTSAQLASAKWDRRASCGLASPQIRLRRAALASVPPPRPHPPGERARFHDFWGFFRGDERGMRGGSDGIRRQKMGSVIPWSCRVYVRKVCLDSFPLHSSPPKSADALNEVARRGRGGGGSDAEA